MKDRGPLANMMKKSLRESLATDMLARLALDVFSAEYDLYDRTGYPASVAIPSQVAADCIVDDAVAESRFLHLAERLAKLDREGFMGRPYRVAGLREILKGIATEGYLWDEETASFMEDPRIRRTPNWGRLLEGEEHRFALLRVDVVRNSRLVRVHGEAAARDAFGDLRGILSRCVERRAGRIWSWEGDGALAAFLFGHCTTCAVLAGMALLHELFLYDRIHNNLGEPLKVRAAVHTGPIRYSADLGEIVKQETVLEALEAESKWTPPGTLTVTPAVAPTLDRVILDRFKADRSPSSRALVYEVRIGTA